MCLPHSSYGIPGLVPFTNVLFWGLRDFYVSFSDRDRYVRDRLKSSLREFYGRYGDLIKHYEGFLSKMLHDILGHAHIQWHPPFIRHFTKSWPCYRTGPYYRFWRYYLIPGGVHRTLQRVLLANGGRQLLWTPGPVQFGTCFCSNVDTILSWICHVDGRFESLSTSILLLNHHKTICTKHLY